MSKLLVVVIFLFSAFAFWKLTSDPTLETPLNTKVTPSVQNHPAQIKTESLFIPYWNVPASSSVEKYDRLFYFGVSADFYGIDKSDEGYLNMGDFSRTAGGKTAYLTVRMLDSDLNLRILKDEAARRRVVSSSVEAAKSNNFDGLILDLELSALPFSNVKSQINTMVSDFNQAAKSNNLQFAVAMYGDVFYRNRPFDMEHIVKNSDEVLIMAYDFHKSYGEPGPNFPLDGRETYGYDLRQMIDDYLEVAPPEKLTVIFGMYGYDWVVDEKKRPIKRAKALSYLDIKEDFVDSCEWKNCLVLPDAKSSETEINYVDSSSYERAVNHIIWFEDERSVGVKKSFLNKKGIVKTAYWVYGYF